MRHRHLLALLVLWPCAARAADPGERLTRIDEELASEHFGTAVVLCEQAAKEGELSLELKASCGKAYVGLGDRLLASGSPGNARRRWEEAAQIDPRLMDDPAFLKRLEGATPAGPDKTKPAEPTLEPRPKPLPKKRLPLPEPRTGMPKNAGPRWDRDLGLGLSFGFDGMAALTVGWLTDETVLVEVSLGIIYPTADVRVRWYGLRNCVTPVVGLGLLVPFGESDRIGLGVATYDSLYELGESFHLDIGVAYTPVHRLDIYLGIAFMTPFDQDHPDTVLFFPQVAGGIGWYF